MIKSDDNSSFAFSPLSVRRSAALHCACSAAANYRRPADDSYEIVVAYKNRIVVDASPGFVAAVSSDQCRRRTCLPSHYYRSCHYFRYSFCSRSAIVCDKVTAATAAAAAAAAVNVVSTSSMVGDQETAAHSASTMSDLLVADSSRTRLAKTCATAIDGQRTTVGSAVDDRISVRATVAVFITLICSLLLAPKLEPTRKYRPRPAASGRTGAAFLLLLLAVGVWTRSVSAQSSFASSYLSSGSAAGSHRIIDDPVVPDGQQSLPNSCSNCHLIRDMIKNITLEEIKQSILQKLGFKQAPNISGLHLPQKPNELPPFQRFLKLYNSDEQQTTHRVRHKHNNYYNGMMNDEMRPADEDDYPMRTQTILAVAKLLNCSAGTNHCQKYKNQSPMFFAFEEKHTHSRLVTAKLWLFQFPWKQDITSPVLIKIYKLNPRNTSVQQYTEIYSAEKVLSTGSQWISLDLQQQLTEHFREYGVSNLSLIAHATFTANNMTSSKVPMATDIRSIKSEHYYPCLEIETEDVRRPRMKRQTVLNCKEDSNEKRCCRYPLTVDFEQYKWDFVIAPKTYEANYCSGECTYGYMQNYPHTHIVQMSKLVNIGPCCSARKLSPITMLYYDLKGNIIYGVLQNMVVERCGCF